jgi:hypothetical protein
VGWRAAGVASAAVLAAGVLWLITDRWLQTPLLYRLDHKVGKQRAHDNVADNGDTTNKNT